MENGKKQMEKVKTSGREEKENDREIRIKL